ncbi:prokaryotic type I DNA topoisomerase [Periconia macrospinosa]|uniref:DNA topoisomerase n=1 Tax=Periconia macrospinosa TaxID=97972 RepID=A0A2V1DNC0_9PLEO|nr:prokaryotic type I DNA topoisomerase [Periconia macrospinosa]
MKTQERSRYMEPFPGLLHTGGQPFSLPIFVEYFSDLGFRGNKSIAEWNFFNYLWQKGLHRLRNRIHQLSETGIDLCTLSDASFQSSKYATFGSEPTQNAQSVMTVRTVLCVVEKSTIAKAIANHLGNQVTTLMEVQDNIQGNPCKSWTSCDPSALFDARIEVCRHARRVDVLYIWTDCDREGEHIGSEIRSVVTQSNQALGRVGDTVRAHFSNTDRAHIIHASQHPTNLDEAQADAVASRIEIDLRGIQLTHKKAGTSVKFSWARKHLFDRMTVVILYEWCLASQKAQWKPLPLTTLELQKCGSRLLGPDSQKVLQLAEKLYQKDQFDQGMDLRGLDRKQTQGGPWATYATALLEGGFTWPRNGPNNDKAHPPIHPVNLVTPSALSHEEQRVHEFIVRRFLAYCSKDAQGATISMSTFTIGGATKNFPRTPKASKTSAPGYLTEPHLLALMDANGIGTDATMAEHIATIIERQYVEARAQPRQALHGNDEEASEELPVQATRLRGGRNSGTGPCGTTNGVRELLPTTLGVALVEGHENMGFETNLTKLCFTQGGKMELKMSTICNQQRLGS